MIALSIPINIDPKLFALLQDILRRAPDGTVVPLFVDYVNQRIIIGATSASAAPAKVEVVSGSVKIVTPGYGIIVPAASGNFYMIGVEEVTNEDGSIMPVLTATRQ